MTTGLVLLPAAVDCVGYTSAAPVGVFLSAHFAEFLVRVFGVFIGVSVVVS